MYYMEDVIRQKEEEAYVYEARVKAYLQHGTWLLLKVTEYPNPHVCDVLCEG